MMDQRQAERVYVISIIIATFNAGKNLRACLSSIEAQTCAGIEIIVADGGSTDDTVDILRSCKHPGLSWHSEPDKGIYDALNKGIQRAGGRWFYFLGSDDQLLPGFSEMVEKLHSADTVYYGIPKAYYLPGKRPDYVLLAGKFSGYRMAKYCLNHQVILYPAAIFLKYKYQPRYVIFADYVLNMQVWGDRAFRKKFIPIEIALYNMTGFSARTKDPEFEKNKPSLVRKSLGVFVYWRWRFKILRKKWRGETF